MTLKLLGHDAIGLCIKLCCLTLKTDMKWRSEKVEANKLLLIVRVWTESLGFLSLLSHLPIF